MTLEKFPVFLSVSKQMPHPSCWLYGHPGALWQWSGLDQPKGTDDPKCTSSPRMWFSAPVSEVVSRGETQRPVWGLMDKCYPVTTQEETQSQEWEQTNLRGHDPQGNKRTKCHCPQGGDWHLVSG
nr:uncharacterized protein LOC108407519 isoform X2 [Manis javanica]